jgi:hypothetical protein
MELDIPTGLLHHQPRPAPGARRHRISGEERQVGSAIAALKAEQAIKAG